LAEQRVHDRREFLGVGHGGDWKSLPWTPSMDAALGQMPDDEAAQRLGLCRRAIRRRRRILGVKAYRPVSDGTS
jgi:hypothetical protein